MPRYRNKRTGETVDLPDGIQPSPQTLDLYAGIQKQRSASAELPWKSAPAARGIGSIVPNIAAGKPVSPLDTATAGLPTEQTPIRDTLGAVGRALIEVPQPIQDAGNSMRQKMAVNKQHLAARAQYYPDTLSTAEKFTLGSRQAMASIMPGADEGFTKLVEDQATPLNAIVAAVGPYLGGKASEAFNRIRKGGGPPSPPPAPNAHFRTAKIQSRIANPVTGAEVDSMGLGTSPAEQFRNNTGQMWAPQENVVPPKATSNPLRGSEVRSAPKPTPEQTADFVDTVKTKLDSSLGKVKNRNADGVQEVDDVIAATKREAAAIRQSNRITDTRATAAEQRADAEWYKSQQRELAKAETDKVNASKKVEKVKQTFAEREAAQQAKLVAEERKRLVNEARGAFKRAENAPPVEGAPPPNPRHEAYKAAKLDRKATDTANHVADRVLGQESSIIEPFRKPAPAAGASMGPSAPAPASPPPAPTAPPPPPMSGGKLGLRPDPTAEAAADIAKKVPEARVIVQEIMGQQMAKVNQEAAQSATGKPPAAPGASKGPKGGGDIPPAAPAAPKAPKGPPPVIPGKGGVAVQERFTPNQQAGSTELETLLDRAHGVNRPTLGEGALANGFTHPPTEPPAIDETTLRQLAELEQLMAARKGSPAAAEPPPAPAAPSGPGPINFNEMTPPNARTEDVLRNNPRFQALSKGDRAARYKELGGANAGMRNAMGPTPNKGDAGFMTPEMMATLLKTTGGGVAGSALDEDHPWRGAAIGAGLGLASSLPMGEGSKIKQALEMYDKLRYEGMLSGGAQVTNLVGNIGGMVSAPIVRALQGDPVAMRQLAEAYRFKNAWPQFKSGFKEGFDPTNMESTKFGNRPIGPAGRTLRGVDRGVKNIMESGGMTPREAEIFTVSGDPVTGPGKALEMGQSNPVSRFLSPFVRTAINQGELGASLTPLRWTSKNLQDLTPSNGPVSEAALGLSGLAPLIAGLNGYTPQNASASTLMGAFTAPAQLGTAIRDYKMNGRGGAADVARAAVNQVPFLSDVVKFTENPGQALEHLATQPIPAGLYAIDKMLGGGHVKETHGIGEAIQDRIPGWRNSLPDRRNFWGEPLERNWLGQYPQPLHSKDNHLGTSYNDPVAGKLGELGVLRREPSSTYTLGNAEKAAGFSKPDSHEKSRLQQLRGESSKAILTAVMNSPSFSTMSVESQQAIMKLAQSYASSAATKAFQAERITKKATSAK